MPDGLSEELAAKKKDRNHELHMDRFRDSQRRLAQSKQHADNQIMQLRCGYFRRVYGDQWREVMEGIRAETDGEID
jgi:hypothetical protein